MRKSVGVAIIVGAALPLSACGGDPPSPVQGPTAETSGVDCGHGRDLSANELEPKARDLWADTFAGLWLGREHRIFIAFTDDAERKVARLAECYPRPHELEAVTFERPLRELEQLQHQIIGNQESDDRVVPDSYDVDIDVKRNVVVAIVEQATEETRDAFRERYGQAVVVREGSLAEPAIPEGE